MYIFLWFSYFSGKEKKIPDSYCTMLSCSLVKQKYTQITTLTPEYGTKCAKIVLILFAAGKSTVIHIQQNSWDLPSDHQ